MNNQQNQVQQSGIRINGSMMSEFVGHYVTLIGSVLSCEGTNIVHIEACDGVSVPCVIPSGNQVFQNFEGVAVEMIGTVDNKGSLNVQHYVGLNLDAVTDDGKPIPFDMGTYNNLIKLAHSGPFRSIFDPTTPVE